MKKIVSLSLLFVLIAAQAVFAETQKIGVVDLMKALNESDSGKKAKTELEGLIKTKQASLDAKGKEIERLKADLEKQSSVLSNDAKKSKEDELERMLRDYQRLVSDSQADVKKREGEATAGIIKELRAVVDKIAKEGDYTLVLENADGLVLFTKKDLDLTEAVIKRYNESKSENKK